MRFGFGSDVGKVRQINEDAYFCSRSFMAVADGMGGAVGGEVASATALKALKESLHAYEEVGASSGTNGGDAAMNTDRKWEDIVRTAIVDANRAVLKLAMDTPELMGMGTTLTVAKFLPGACVIGHVGDSRAYLLREGRLWGVTQDHSVAAELVRSGDLTEREARFHPQRHLLTRAIGATTDIAVDVAKISLAKVEGILLCSDGLTGVTTDDEIAEVIGRHDHPQAAVDALIDLANARGGPDNITVVLALFEEPRSD